MLYWLQFHEIFWVAAGIVAKSACKISCKLIKNESEKSAKNTQRLWKLTATISQFTVRVVDNIIERHNLYAMLSTQCKAPDHYVVTVDIACGYVNQQTNNYHGYTCNIVNNTDTGQNVINSHARVRKYRLSEPPPDFMNNDVWRYAINKLISHTEQFLQTQVEIDQVY